MSIEKDINQQRFRNEHQKAAINLIYSGNWLMEKIKNFFEVHELTPQQFNILRILRGAHAPLSTLQIRERMLDKMSDTSRIVDRMVKKALVKKSICKVDRRLVDVIITRKGEKLLEVLDEKNDEMDAVMKNINEEEARKLNTLLDRIRSRE